jgi:alanyl-tRNA synthetase
MSLSSKPFISSNQLRQKFLDFMVSKGHSILPSASLVPKEDPTVLFNTAGMQPLVPYLMGISQHPLGKRLANSQKCVRTADIDEVGDNRHLTFFEMLGNWSIGDYFKQESIQWSFEFLTSPNWLGLNPNRVYVTTYKGGTQSEPDLESVKIWQQTFKDVGIEADFGLEYDFKNQIGEKFIYRITQKSAKDNWWGLPHRGPCGACTEIYYLSDDQPEDFQTSILPNLSPVEVENWLDNNIVEIWNNVFMEFEGEWGQFEGKPDPVNLTPLETKNVDTGMGFERILAFLNHQNSVYQTDVLAPLVDNVENWQKNTQKSNLKPLSEIFTNFQKTV